jgi:hypothetical protein
MWGNERGMEIMENLEIVVSVCVCVTHHPQHPKGAVENRITTYTIDGGME